MPGSICRSKPHTLIRLRPGSRVHRTRRSRSLLQRQPRSAVELPRSTKIDARSSRDFHMTGACDGRAAAILRAVCRAIFATYSLRAFLNKKQGISPFHANLIQRSPPGDNHFNESLQFRLGSGGIDLGARSKSFGTRSWRSSPSGTFIGFLRTSFSNFLGKLVRWFSRATLACWSGAELFRTEIMSPRSKALSKIFENSEPQISEKDGEMKKGTEGQIMTAGWSAISNFSRS
jgi:hypothetical protein